MHVHITRFSLALGLTPRSRNAPRDLSSREGYLSVHLPPWHDISKRVITIVQYSGTDNNERPRSSIESQKQKTVFRPISARLPPRSALLSAPNFTIYSTRKEKNSPKVWSSFAFFGEPDRPRELSLKGWITKVLCLSGWSVQCWMYCFLWCEEHCTVLYIPYEGPLSCAASLVVCIVNVL